MLKHFSSILCVFGCVYICVPNVSDAFGVQKRDSPQTSYRRLSASTVRMLGIKSECFGRALQPNKLFK